MKAPTGEFLVREMLSNVAVMPAQPRHNHDSQPSLTDAQNWAALGTGALRLVMGAKRSSCWRVSSAERSTPRSSSRDFDDNTMDACLIAAGQRAEHDEMAAYGTLVAWAKAMGHTEAADLLRQTLDEQKAADEKLSALAEGGINQSAADAAHADDENEEPATVGAGVKRPRASKARSGARRQVQR